MKAVSALPMMMMRVGVKIVEEAAQFQTGAV